MYMLMSNYKASSDIQFKKQLRDNNPIAVSKLRLSTPLQYEVEYDLKEMKSKGLSELNNIKGYSKIKSHHRSTGDSTYSTFVLKERDLNGPGEMGKAVVIDEKNLTTDQKMLWKAGWDKNAFNQYVSDMISVERSLPDYRWQECKNLTYEDLPQVSVVIPFVNESWSTLLRTVHSVLNRSPPHLLKEIVLCDDASSMEHLGKPLDDYVALFEKVSVQRLENRGGLINARILGFNHSTAPVVIFLDSHCEVTTGWLEPLLDRIKNDDKTIVTAVMDIINAKDFHVQAYNIEQSIPVGDLEWTMFFKWKHVPLGKPRIKPVKSATLIGCFIGVSRTFFKHIGMFDPGFFIWGGENLELSFKAWMCGGSVETLPCSHVGHVYKNRLPYSWGGQQEGSVIERNLLRLAEVWLDDYKEFFYQIIGPERVSEINAGNYSDRVALRHNLGCKNFSWYLQQAIPDVFLPSECHGWGPIKNQQYPDVCIDQDDNESNLKDSIIRGARCGKMMYQQQWYHCHDETIRRKRACWIPTHKNTSIAFDFCIIEKQNFQWEYRHDNTIYSVYVQKCVEMQADQKTIKLAPCSDTTNQKWTWKRGPPPGPVPDWKKKSQLSN
ncbi:hypothetical protein SNE40_022605 [Patella caerulea]|uniref:Polypeptide N-acetylgalactosaminyltransferase n=2 Tax=Patella caerulea TaxID=87958 RepID=A0AAN8J3Y9_PATCE